MRFFQDIEMAFSELVRDMAEMGVRYESATVQDKISGEETIELMNYGYTISQVYYDEIVDYIVFKHNDKFPVKIDREWLHQELRDRVIGRLNPGISWEQNKDFWKPFLREGCFSYHYGERMGPQIQRVIWELNHRPNTRQAIITMYDQHQDLMNWGGRDRVPCSMHYQFMIRQNKLHLMYVMRSCDLFKFFIADVALAVGLMEHILSNLKSPTPEMGSFTHVIGSLHAFKSDVGGIF